MARPTPRRYPVPRQVAWPLAAQPGWLLGGVLADTMAMQSVSVFETANLQRLSLQLIWRYRYTQTATRIHG